MSGTCLSNFNALQPQLLFSPHSFLPLYEQTTKNHSSPSLESWDDIHLRGSETVPILITQIFWGCRRPSLTTIVMDTELAQPITPPPPLPLSLPPFLMPPRLRVDSASLWQLLITGWPGPAALCMTASRPAQVTQREGETERDGEKGGLAGQRKTEGGGGRKKEEIESGIKDRGGRERERNREVEQKGWMGEEKGVRMGGREVYSGGDQHSGLERTD